MNGCHNGRNGLKISKRLITGSVLVASLIAARTGRTQRPESTNVGLGSVTGHVLCADTQRPARFAEVALVHNPSPAELKSGDGGQAGAKRANAPEIVMASAQTRLDGSYAIRNVPPGEYFVMAKLPGYIGPISDLKSEDGAGNLEKVLSGATIVHVTAGRSVLADLTLHRGGVVAGTVRFDDAMPLAGAEVKAEPVTAALVGYLNPGIDWIARGRYVSTTNDEGRYRLTGLPPGKYRVHVNVQIAGEFSISSNGDSQHHLYSQSGRSSIFSFLQVYEPGTLRESESKVFEIKGDEQDIAADITVDLEALHTVRGKVTADDPEVPFVLGVITLLDTEDKTFWRSCDVEPDGSFEIQYVPSGTYTLAVAAGVRRPDPTGPGKLRQFKTDKLPLMVGDEDIIVNDVRLEEQPPAPEP